MNGNRDAEAEQLGDRNYGPRYANGNGNGAQKVIWAWAGFATLIAAGAIGTWMVQNTNDVSNLKSEIARIEQHVEYLQRELDRLEK